LFGEEAFPGRLGAADAGDVPEVVESLHARCDDDESVGGVIWMGAEGVIALRGDDKQVAGTFRRA